MFSREISLNAPCSDIKKSPFVSVSLLRRSTKRDFQYFTTRAAFWKAAAERTTKVVDRFAAPGRENREKTPFMRRFAGRAAFPRPLRRMRAVQILFARAAKTIHPGTARVRTKIPVLARFFASFSQLFLCHWRRLW
ncbi:MAG TPA: hypothetical protein PKW41_11040 [Clostridia bacterium]|jgi:hypothetical protein|nr:hypothetical protein [Clostridia bacterium]HPK16521.1 hypothetical protein [Clostridia bacterium]